jgi:hypothetical protein
LGGLTLHLVHCITIALWISKASCLLPITPNMVLFTYQRYSSL